jgi:hypothetical protein
MNLIRKIPTKAKRSSRWRSIAHCNHVRLHECVGCGSHTSIVAAHVRLGSHTGLSQKPHDWLTVPLCDGPEANIDSQLGCHNRQHIVGEATFWRNIGKDPAPIIEALIDTSPKRVEIRAERAAGG